MPCGTNRVPPSKNAYILVYNPCETRNHGSWYPVGANAQRRDPASPSMVFTDISRLVRPSRVAVVGASDRPGSLGYSTYNNVQE